MFWLARHLTHLEAPGSGRGKNKSDDHVGANWRTLKRRCAERPSLHGFSGLRRQALDAANDVYFGDLTGTSHDNVENDRS